MPFKSEAQRKMMWARHPAIARRWAHKYGSTPITTNVQQRRTKPSTTESKVPVGRRNPPTPVVRRNAPKKNEGETVSRTTTAYKTPPTGPSTPPSGPGTFKPTGKYEAKTSPPKDTVETGPEPKVKQQAGTVKRNARSSGDRDKIINALNRMRGNKKAFESNKLDKVQQMQRKGLMVANVGRPNYSGPINTRAQNIAENKRKYYG